MLMISEDEASLAACLLAREDFISLAGCNC